MRRSNREASGPGLRTRSTTIEVIAPDPTTRDESGSQRAKAGGHPQVGPPAMLSSDRLGQTIFTAGLCRAGLTGPSAILLPSTWAGCGRASFFFAFLAALTLTLRVLVTAFLA